MENYINSNYGNHINPNKIRKPNESYYDKDASFEEFNPNFKENNYINQ